jgi:hypothetical protein
MPTRAWEHVHSNVTNEVEFLVMPPYGKVLALWADSLIESPARTSDDCVTIPMVTFRGRDKFETGDRLLNNVRYLVHQGRKEFGITDGTLYVVDLGALDEGIEWSMAICFAEPDLIPTFEGRPTVFGGGDWLANIDQWLQTNQTKAPVIRLSRYERPWVI